MRRKRSRAGKLEKGKTFGEKFNKRWGEMEESRKVRGKRKMMRWGGREERNRRGEDWMMLKEETQVWFEFDIMRQ